MASVGFTHVPWSSRNNIVELFVPMLSLEGCSNHVVRPFLTSGRADKLDCQPLAQRPVSKTVAFADDGNVLVLAGSVSLTDQ